MFSVDQVHKVTTFPHNELSSNKVGEEVFSDNEAHYKKVIVVRETFDHFASFPADN
ncbi:hypothetical protein [Paenibacillus sp. 1A_MP2]|uniref:hypothetical protein n=1 Tax=Paenibacillus sp. 1A_MP2 TaxID=3457495 RepID=UPI003FCE26F4